MGVSYQSNCNFSRNSLSVIKSTDEWERRVILEKLSVGPPSLEVTRHLVAQHTKINNSLKDTTPHHALIKADGILDQLPS